MSKTIFITGATSGIGQATARILGKQGHNLIICGRRAERLLKLKSELDTDTKVYTLNFDVRDNAEVVKAINSLPEDLEIDVLINNAGNAHGLAPIQDGDIHDWDAMIDINVKGLLYVTKALLPRIEKSKKAHIINIGSTAGREVYPKGNVYNASKFAVHALSEAMRIDLMDKKIKVSQIAPGAVNTEFSKVRFKGDQEKADKVYEGFDALSAKDIAELIEFMISRPRHVNLADVLILPTAQVKAGMIHKES